MPRTLAYVRVSTSGLASAKAEGVVLSRPAALAAQRQAAVRKAAGASVAAVAQEFGTRRQTVMRVRDAVAKAA